MTKLKKTLSILSLFESVLDEFGVSIDSQSFNMDQFKSLNSFRKREQYCNQHLKRISSGSSRIAYILNNNMVLKLAKNQKGINQNETEGDYSIQNGYGLIVTQIHELDNENDLWLVSEFAKNISESRFEQLTGINFKKLCNFLQLEDQHNKYKDKTILSKDEIDFMWNNEFTYHVVGLMQNYEMSSGDLTKIGSWGEVNRNGKSMAVIRDYGLNNDTYTNQYKK